jgi:glycosyltransferase involved in cell wall biosynthesis
MNPLVSILIPAYNAEEWIADTIRSTLGQTWPRKEIIIVDDGSTDRTLSIAREFASGDVSVFTQPNQGASAARNKAYAVSKGDYIQWLDADDLLAPDKLEKQMHAVSSCQSNRTLFSSAWAYFAYRRSKARFIRDAAVGGPHAGGMVVPQAGTEPPHANRRRGSSAGNCATRPGRGTNA